MSDSNRSFRSSQLISPFGPGAIIELGDESLILTDPSAWPNRLEKIKLDRLEKEAGVWALKKPPVIKGRNETPGTHNALATVRFPRWMFCPRCKRMEHWQNNSGKKNEDGIPVCGNSSCRNKVLAPMRFVAACDHGHLQDVPWEYWAHKNGRKCEHPELYFLSNPELGSGLDALYVECQNPECGEKHTFKDLMGSHALAALKCCDKQPWDPPKKLTERKCDQTLTVVQRGASNLYYSIVRSALDIPYESASAGNKTYLKIKQSEYFDDLLSAIGKGRQRVIDAYAADIADDCGLTPEEVLRAAMSQEGESRSFKIPKDGDLRLAEWDVLASDNIEQRQTRTFKARIADWSQEETFGFEQLLRRVVLLDKLREVRAFCGFERLSPSDNVVQPKSSQQRDSWLPATEVYGEGIFLEFDPVEIDRWASSRSMPAELRKRLALLKRNYASASSVYLPEPTAGFVLLHTLAHLLIRQLSFESGYASGSLRERIYADGDQAGLLIYTADGDSEGSLGGLVQQGEASRLFPALLAALETAHWCSNDPVCSEKEESGIVGLNLAACHSCTLISETSCENNNLLLDRNILIGNKDYQGFFSQIISRAQEDFSDEDA